MGFEYISSMQTQILNRRKLRTRASSRSHHRRCYAQAQRVKSPIAPSLHHATVGRNRERRYRTPRALTGRATPMLLPCRGFDEAIDLHRRVDRVRVIWVNDNIGSSWNTDRALSAD